MSMVSGHGPGPAPACHARRNACSAIWSSWRAEPQVNERRNVPSVDGAATRWPRICPVAPARSRSASPIHSPPARAEWTRVIALSPALAAPWASPRSRWVRRNTILAGQRAPVCRFKEPTSSNRRWIPANGKQERIGKIVAEKLPVEVLSYDPEIGAVVPKRVVKWFDNGPARDFLKVTVARPDRRGRSFLACTPNHKIRTPGGWREAQELAVGDRVMHVVAQHLSGFQWKVLLGGLMGDSALSPSQNGLAARYRFGHGIRQAE